MRTFAVLALFLCSLLGLGATLSAEANSVVRIEPAFEAPKEMDEAVAKKKDGGRDDEESEEDLVPSEAEQQMALEMLDPGHLDHVIKLQLASSKR